MLFKYSGNVWLHISFRIQVTCPPSLSLSRQNCTPELLSFLTIFYYVNVTYLYINYVHAYGKFTQLSHDSIRNEVSLIVQEEWLILSTTVSLPLMAHDYRRNFSCSFILVVQTYIF